MSRDPSTVELVKGDAKITVHLPMALDDFNPILSVMADRGFEFPHVLEARRREAKAAALSLEPLGPLPRRYS